MQACFETLPVYSSATPEHTGNLSSQFARLACTITLLYKLLKLQDPTNLHAVPRVVVAERVAHRGHAASAFQPPPSRRIGGDWTKGGPGSRPISFFFQNANVRRGDRISPVCWFFPKNQFGAGSPDFTWPNQWFMFTYWQIDFRKVFLIVQYKYLTSLFRGFNSPGIHTRICGTGFISQPSWLFHFCQINMIGRKCFAPVRYQLPKGKSAGMALPYLYIWFIGSGD